MNGAGNIPQNPFWFLEDDEILRRIVLKYEKLLTEDDVADLLGFSRAMSCRRYSGRLVRDCNVLDKTYKRLNLPIAFSRLMMYL